MSKKEVVGLVGLVLAFYLVVFALIATAQRERPCTSMVEVNHTCRAGSTPCVPDVITYRCKD